MGDPSGIGPFIILPALKKLNRVADCVVIGDATVLRKASGIHRTSLGSRLIDLQNVDARKFSFGRIDPKYGKASLEYVDRALSLLRRRELDCLVTCPISKEAIARAGFPYPGHTEYLASKTSRKRFLMMLLNKGFKVSLVTRHIPLKKVSSFITTDQILHTILMTVKGLRELFGILYPRVAVCGLNPHASDNGLIGNEELRAIRPAILRLKRKRGCRIDGPIPSDTAMFQAARGRYDAVVAMYHDQALIPLKLLGNDSGVNLTIGLPFVRTSCLHGTAFDLVRSNPRQADWHSLHEAIRVALQCTLKRKKD